MKIFIIVLAVLLVIAGGIAVYLNATVPREGVLIRFPLDGPQLELLARVPADADDYALALSAASLERKLLGNPVTRTALSKWLDEQPLPGPWLLGGADVVLWRHGRETSYAVRFDPVRASLARAWMLVAGHDEAHWEGRLLVIEHEPSRGGGADPAIRSLSAALPAADVFFVQRTGEKGEFPPIQRPAVSSVQLGAKEIILVSRSSAADFADAPATKASFPAGAMLSAAFSADPRILGDFGRLLGTNLSAITAGGGRLVLYEMDAGTLLPRPRGLLIVPTTDEVREAIEDVRPALELVGEVREEGAETIVAFDHRSLAMWNGALLRESPWPGNHWQVRAEPDKLIPAVRRLSGNPGLRLLAPRLHRTSRDLERWTAALEGTASIEAADSVAGGVEELRVRVVSK
jgi:hypothetical protein